MVFKANGKIVVLTGKKQIRTMNAAEQAKLVTTEQCMAASGKSINALLIFHSKWSNVECSVAALSDTR